MVILREKIRSLEDSRINASTFFGDVRIDELKQPLEVRASNLLEEDFSFNHNRYINEEKRAKRYSSEESNRSMVSTNVSKIARDETL